MKIKTVSDILEAAKASGKTWRISVAAAHDEPVLKSVAEAVEAGFVTALLYGDEQKIRNLAEEQGITLGDGFTIIPTSTKQETVTKAVDAVEEGRADVLVKGIVATASLLRAVLNKELGLRSGQLLSHVAVFYAPVYNRLMLLTDPAINITPNVHRKVLIVRNAIKVAQRLGIEQPRVAMLASVDTLNYPAMEATLDAALVAKIIRSTEKTNAVVDGPFALDNAICSDAVSKKARRGKVAGRANILCAPEIETANVLYKSLQCFAQVTFAGVVIGARRPLAVSSRADSCETKLASIALACLMCDQ